MERKYGGIVDYHNPDYYCFSALAALLRAWSYRRGEGLARALCFYQVNGDELKKIGDT
jgi:hypothetical protein